MNRFWLGVGLLVLFLVAGIWSTVFLDTVHEPISETLEQATEQIIAGDLDEGIRLSQQARQKWRSCWGVTALVIDHDPVEQIDALFAQMEVCGKAGFEEEFAAACASASALIRAVSNAHGFTWWNLF